MREISMGCWFNNERTTMPPTSCSTSRSVSASSDRLSSNYNAGARPQRLLWASTGSKDPKASDVLYVQALAAPFTVNTIPEVTLKALADHGIVGATMPIDGGNSDEVLSRFAAAGINVQALAAQKTRAPKRLSNRGTI
jgi:transaldolase